MLRALLRLALMVALVVALIATACTDAPVDLDAQRRCVALPDSATWQVVDTAAYHDAVRRCLRR